MFSLAIMYMDIILDELKQRVMYPCCLYDLSGLSNALPFAFEDVSSTEVKKPRITVPL
jgi:hypothetical protein